LALFALSAIFKEALSGLAGGGAGTKNEKKEEKKE
jgi:hypothetical protein